ncbi:mandelate racemase/muconate lactonizing enzyme family protein [Actinomadura sp. DC4]|uniref:mandelate racemase/muconate lactonizing enzyme family protein n=1 Tax=Actinomadura sp. DC4 TaxID=3055069 RepID=UPI0025B13D42|nr:mandelate racemase/muconate lactonizing enzyme family protein [Actinomadura sp. DC4]MDN3356324.1 mandelate racemase/muconate lactonizing enzyme family protein [Actinomadura sp. DC4]
MRITGLSTHVVGTPWRNLTYVQVHTDEGLSGVGEAWMLNHTDALIGYQALKFDPFGSGTMELDHTETMRSVSLVEAVRDAIGEETELLIEMHGRFSPATAIRLAGLLTPFKPSWIEEPCPPENLKALAKVSAHTDLPIATGERIHDRIEFRELFELQAADVIQPDISHIGGITETRKLAATAETHYAMIAPHNVGGHFTLPDAPGLGIELDVEARAEFPRQRANFDLFADNWQLRDPERTGPGGPA